MSKSQKKHIPQKPVAKKQIADKPVVKKQVSVPQTFLERMDKFLQKHDKLLFWIIFAITVLFAVQLYDPRVSLGGDDSAYIVRAQDFIRHFTLPGGFQGPLYPMVISPIVAVFGVSLMPIKAFSLLSMLAFMYFTFIAFRRRIPASILIPMLLLVAVNSSMLYYASQTYSEAFYMFVQALVIFLFFRFFVDGQDNKFRLRSDWCPLLWLSLALLAATMTRSVAFSLVIAVAGYFLFYGRWKKMVGFIAVFVTVYIVYLLLKAVIWGNGDLQFASQGSTLLQKNAYRPEEGQEDLLGLIVRFWGNSRQYLGNALYKLFGFQFKTGDNSIVRTVIIFVVLLGGWLFSFKRNKALSFALMTMLTFLGVTFVVLQVSWNQSRLIIPAFPFIIMGILACFYYLLSLKKLHHLQLLYPLLIAVMFVIAGRYTVKTAIPEAKKLTNQYSGLPVEWVNFTKASYWASKNLPDSALVMSRKPDISFIYGRGREFASCYTVPSGNSVAFMQDLKADTSKYKLLAATKENQAFFYTLTDDYFARVVLKDTDVWVFRNTPMLDARLTYFKAQPMSFSRFETVSASTDNKFSMYYPDSLLNNWRQREIKYIITAEIGYNTVERYAYYVQEKYPSFYEMVHQEGTEKPAKIYRLRWETLKKD